MADIFSFENIVSAAAHTAAGKDRAEEQRKREQFDWQREESKSRIAMNEARRSYYEFQAKMQSLSDEDTVDLMTKIRKIAEPRQNWQTGQEEPADRRLIELSDQIIRKIQQARQEKGKVAPGFMGRVAGGLEKELTSGFNNQGSALSNVGPSATRSPYPNTLQGAPSLQKRSSALPSLEVPSISGGTAQPIPQPKTREEWQALPPGTVFIDPDGVRRVR